MGRICALNGLGTNCEAGWKTQVLPRLDLRLGLMTCELQHKPPQPVNTQTYIKGN